MAHKANFNPNFLALKSSCGINTLLGHDHIVAVTEVVDENSDAFLASGSRYESVSIGHANGIHLASRKAVHRWNVIKPNELDLYSGILEETLLPADFPCHPSGPVAISNPKGFSRGIVAPVAGSR